MQGESVARRQAAEPGAGVALPVATTQRCWSCGSSVDRGERFCSNCGSSLIEEREQSATVRDPQRAAKTQVLRAATAGSKRSGRLRPIASLRQQFCYSPAL
jgi:predicted amidophosphoribosyltransferase